MKIKVLMTGGGAPGAAGIIRCLKQDPGIEIFLCDANPVAVGRFLNDKFITIPKANDPTFIDTILDLCKEHKVDVVLPLVTRELFHFAKHKKTFEANGTKVLVSDDKALNIANDKSSLYRFLEEKKIAVPAYRVVGNLNEFVKAVSELGYPNEKVCFKPSVSNGSRGFRIIDDKADEFDLLFNHKPNSTYISFEKIKEILEKNDFPELLVSEFLPGEEYSVDCLAKNGKCIVAIPRLRSKMLNGISIEGEFIFDREIIDYSVKIIEAIGLHGNIGIQVKRAASGKFLILEINPRVQGTIVSALGAGVNLPLLAVKQEMGVAINESEMKVKWGTRFSRFWNEVYY